jgi:hypothetical protein
MSYQPALRRAIILAVLLFPALFLSESSLKAQAGAGIRGGVSVNPDQFYFGGHVAVGPLVERLWFRPNLEIGIGDNRTAVGFNGEFTYWFPPFRRSEWSLYAGAGPALHLIRFDEDRFGQRDTEAEGGFNILLGLGHSGGLFTELKVGALHSPDIKFGVGYSFR